MPPPDSATRDEVLRWMAKEGKGYKAAATHYGLHQERVKTWVRRAPPDGPPAEAAKPAAKVAGKSPEQPPGSRVRASDLTPLLRSNIRRSVDGLARYIAGAADPADTEDGEPVRRADMQQVAHAARALDILLARVPDLMTFEERTQPQSVDQGDASALAAAMGVDPAGPPVLRIVARKQA